MSHLCHASASHARRTRRQARPSGGGTFGHLLGGTFGHFLRGGARTRGPEAEDLAGGDFAVLQLSQLFDRLHRLPR
eukprot:894274-Prorocentrum_minimum.AAC.1